MEQNRSTDPALVDSLKSWLIDWMARELKRDRSKIDPGRDLLSYGLDSVKVMMMLGDLETKLNLELPPTLIWDHRDINDLSAHLSDRFIAAHSRTSQPDPLSSASVNGTQGHVAELDALGDGDVEGLVGGLASGGKVR
jgi:acyl carrier protein